jgi:hypothetical protein
MDNKVDEGLSSTLQKSNKDSELEKDISLKGLRIPNSIRQQLRQTRKKLTEGKPSPLLKKKIKPIGLTQIHRQKATQESTINTKPGILSKGQKKNKTFKRVRFAIGDKESSITDGVFTEPPRLRLKNKSVKSPNHSGKRPIKLNSIRKTFKIRIINSPPDSETESGYDPDPVIIPDSVSVHEPVSDSKTKNDIIDLNIENIDDTINSVGESPILKDRGHIYVLKGTPDDLIRNLTVLTEDVEVYKN